MWKLSTELAAAARGNSRFFFVCVEYTEDMEAAGSGSSSNLRNTFFSWLAVYCFSLGSGLLPLYHVIRGGWQLAT